MVEFQQTGCPAAKKPKIGFYLGNSMVPNADLRFPEQGNPGIGGSEFAFVTLPYFFSLYHEDFDLVIYANVTAHLPIRLVSIQVNDSTEATRRALEDNCQILIVCLRDRDINSAVIKEISGSKLHIILWAHNYPSSQQMELVASCKQFPVLSVSGMKNWIYGVIIVHFLK